MAFDVDQDRLEQGLIALEKARGWTPRLVRRLERLICDGADPAVFRINPYRFAGDQGIAEDEAIELFLHATAVGMFRMDWLMLCPVCGCVVESFSALTGLNPNFRCTLCHTDFDTALDEFVAVTFTVAPAVRRTAFEHPETLPAETLVFDYCLSADGETPRDFFGLAEGLPWRQALRDAFLILRYLEPEERVTLRVAAAPGHIENFDPDNDVAFRLKVGSDHVDVEQPVSARLSDGGWQPATASVSAGPLVLDIVNATGGRRLLGLLQMPAGYAHQPIRFRPFLSGRDLLNTQTFRELFGFERIRGPQGLAVRDVTILFTDIAGSTALYDRLGDLNAFSMVQQHFSLLQNVVSTHRGAIIKTIGDAVMAAFSRPADAVTAAAEMVHPSRLIPRGSEAAIALKIGVHRGAAIAVTLNERLDYFGQTVNAASRLQRIAGPEEICISETVEQYPGVEPLLAPFQVTRQLGQFRGMDRPLSYLRLARSL